MERLKIAYTKKYKKDYLKIQKQGHDMSKLNQLIKLLLNREELSPIYKDHALYGKYEGLRECYIEPDGLLIYKINNNTLELILTITGSHANLFK